MKKKEDRERLMVPPSTSTDTLTRTRTRDEMELKLEKRIGYPYFEIERAETYIMSNQKDNFVECEICGKKYLISTKQWLDRRFNVPVVLKCGKCRKNKEMMK
jgi:hypothetical protein